MKTSKNLGTYYLPFAYSAKSAHPFRRNGAPFRLKLSNAQLVISYFDLHGGHALEIPIGRLWMSFC